MIIKVKEQDLMGIIESINKANGNAITDTWFLCRKDTDTIACEETVVEHVCNLLGLNYVDDYENYKKIVLENNRNINVEVDEKDLISILDSIVEGCNDGTIVDTVFYNDGKIETGIGGMTLFDHICLMLRISPYHVGQYKEILKHRNEL